MTLCLPWWHALVSQTPKTSLASGCSVDGAGNVPCSPEKLRAGAEAMARKLGYWPQNRPLSLAAYTLGRYMTSEVGSGPPEELVAVAEAARNKARDRKQDVTGLLLYTAKPENRGHYGPIHGGGGLAAPYGRWASTSRDPSAQSLVVADLVLSGESANFAKGATTQWGLDILIKEGTDPYAFVDRLAAKGHYWVGQLPGVNFFHTFLVRENLPKALRMVLGTKLLADAKAAIRAGRPDWSGLPVCPRPLFGPVGRRHAVLGLGLGLGGIVGLARFGGVDVGRLVERRLRR